jgi:HlyD family secretion protein
MNRTIREAALLVILAGLAGGTGCSPSGDTSGSSAGLRTGTVSRGDLVAQISATGTVEPEELVDVGAQVAGQINSFGKDKNGIEIDYNSIVEEGTILAQIDDTLYAADVKSARAQLAQATANKVRAEADLVQLQARLDQAQRDWDRAQKLGPSEALAQSAFDSYKAGYEIAKANLAVGQAALEQGRASVTQAEASLARSERNLSYCTIKSPVQGQIIDRRVNIGQTVVSSLNAPSLFLIANDLRRMQVWVSVNEADVGQIYPGQPVTFTVDAFPGRQFHGQVNMVRLNASMTQNVVTYPVEVNTDNSDGRLLPYLTANALFITGRRTNVLTVPNAALRWTPRPNQIATEFRQKTDSAGGTRPRSGGGRGGRPEGGASSRGTLWVPQGEFVRPIAVKTGLSDGFLTEVEGQDLAENLTVVLGEAQPRAAAGPGGASPFTPQIGAGRRNAAQTGGAEGGGRGVGQGR